jgi:site-specific DNA recombinase
VQQRLAANRVEQKAPGRATSPSLLAGLVYDHAGERLVPTHAVKRGRRYRYYVSKPLQTGMREAGTAGLRLPAGDLERVVAERLRQFLADRAAVYAAIRSSVTDGAEQQRVLTRANEFATTWPRAACRNSEPDAAAAGG